LTSRQDEADGRVYNREDFTYPSNYTGYPTYKNANELPDSYTYNTPVAANNNVRTTYTFNNKHLPNKVETSVSGSKRLEKSFTYDANKHLTSSTQTFYDGSKTRSATELFTYDVFGNLTEYWDSQANGNRNNTQNKTTYTYSANYGIPLTTTYRKDSATIITIRNILSPANQIYLKAIGLTEVSVGSTVIQWTDFAYDDYGNLLTKRNYINNSNSIRTTFGYQNGIFLVSQNVGGVTNSFTYDALGRILTSRDGNSHRDNTNLRTAYAYDELGRITKITNPDNSTVVNTYYDNARTMDTENEIGLKLRTVYDRLGNVKLIQDITNNVYNDLEAYDYDNLMRVTDHTNARGTKTSYTYDYLDRVLLLAII
jgi:YD repeat-containing protein